ncbi:MAG: hypothetical protein JG764_2373 [Clostridiales bacterium]|jgi:hypothetical protein|nr:hypothetical protein [Clostridiales bacterium]
MILLVKRSFLVFIILILFVILYFSFTRLALVTVVQDSNEPKLILKIDFLFPMRQIEMKKNIAVKTEIPDSPLEINATWRNRHILLLTIREKAYPVGQKICYSLKVPTVIPIIAKNISGSLHYKIAPQVLSPKPGERVPTKGPVLLKFNTMVSSRSLTSSLKCEISGKIKPMELQKEGRKFYNYSVWQFIPDQPLEPGASYNFIIAKGLKSASGKTTEKSQEITFTGAEAPNLIKTSPRNKEKNVKLYRTITAHFDHPLGKGTIKVTDPKDRITIPGSVRVDKNKIVYRPIHAFLPDSIYKVHITGSSLVGEPSEAYSYLFRTMPMGENMWVDVKLGKIHTVTVYKGRMPIRHMLASGGRRNNETPLGTFYTKDKGSSFWSPRFGEGATYWVRLVDQYLVHSVPKNSKWQTKSEEHRKLGLPASHGCIRLDEKDAKWFYENVPQGTMVIIHQ